MATTLYLLPSFTPPGVMPSGMFASWIQVPPAGTYNGSGAGYMSLGHGLSTVNNLGITNTGSGTTGCMQFISDPLVAQTISGTVDIGFVLQDGLNAASSAAGKVLIGLLTPTGTLRSTLVPLTTSIGGSRTAAVGSPRTYWGTGFAVTSQSATAGDRLVMEIGAFTITANTSWEAYAGGNSAITADNVAQLNAQSFASFSAALTFQPAIPFASPLVPSAIYRM